MDTLHEALCIFMIISRLILFGMRNVSGKICGENQNTFYYLGVYEIMWKYMVERAGHRQYNTAYAHCMPDT